jgi:glyoxylase-like metal-dependent hydrolase (beta-lactamase superfamily II)
MSKPLQWDVFVSAGPPVVNADFGPGVTEPRWSPTSSTLISGERDAVLVDTFITMDQNRELAEWVTASGKNVTTIYATHGHGDHFFGVNTIRQRFPRARFVAMRDVIPSIRGQLAAPVLDGYWRSRFPDQIDSTLLIAEEIDGNTIDLEGEDLITVPLGHTDTDNTTCLHVPSIGLIVAGDAAYNDVHLHLGESNSDKRKEWIAAIETMRSLEPKAVIAGHKRPGREDAPTILDETRHYIEDFERTAASTRTALELYNEMLALHPDRVNPGILWSSARAIKG